jgi:hypothetical protein
MVASGTAWFVVFFFIVILALTRSRPVWVCVARARDIRIIGPP